MRPCIYALLAVAIMLPNPADVQAGGGSESDSGVQETLLSGGDWKLGSMGIGEGEKHAAFLPTFDDSSFRTALVPGEVQLQLGLKGMDLYYQSKTLSLVNQKEWWYRKSFIVAREQAGKLVRLRFDGADYFATVWLNGEKLGEHEGGNTAFWFDVSSKLKYGDKNLLVVKVTCPWVPEGRAFTEYLKGSYGLTVPDSVLKFSGMPSYLGPKWDGVPGYGNAVFPMGLPRDVKLLISPREVIDDLFVWTKAINADGSATLEVSGKILNSGSQERPAALDLEIAPETFSDAPVKLASQSLSLRSGENSFKAEVIVPQAHFWWTWDLGKPDLYRLKAAISPAGGTPTRQEVVFGIRTIARKPDMSYWLNGQRLFLKGAWYPMADYYGSQPTRQIYEKDLLYYRAANLNSIVNHTVVEKPEFYDLCDHIGILIIVQMPFNQFGPLDVLSPSNPRKDIFMRSALRQVGEIVTEHRNHPSIVEWAPLAEAHEKGGGWGIGTVSFKDYDYDSFVQAIGNLVGRLSPGAIFHPSLCDLGEQHFWMADAGMRFFGGGYQEHFNARTGYVSEYGSVSLPVIESLRKELSPQDLWSTENSASPRWFNLPINLSAYAYLTSFEYDGLWSTLERVNQFVDRHVKSAQELVDDSQIYQSFLFKYATDAYRRKMHKPINGVRIWDFKEVWPGIHWCFLDYFRVPKMSFYYLKRSQERFALNFAYEEALESQVSGKPLEIPVWVVNDYRREMAVDVQCRILDLKGQTVWTRTFSGKIGSDESREMGVVSWVTPDTSGIYVLRGQASEKEGGEKAEDSAFIKVTPKLFSRQLRLLLIGENKYTLPLAKMALAMGLSVDVISEDSIQRLAELRDAAGIRKTYDAVWLASFESLWKFLDDATANGLKEAVRQGVGFIHTGGPGSFHGGFGGGACLDFTPLAEVLPVHLESRNDLVYGPGQETRADPAQFAPIKEIQTEGQPAEKWSVTLLRAYGLPGFNAVDLKPGSEEPMSIAGRPLLVTGHYGEGKTVIFTGFTPSYTEERADWDPKVVYPYMLDQELVADPANKAYFDLFMRMLAEATGERPAAGFDALIASRDKPLFEMLKDLPPAAVGLPPEVKAKVSGNKATIPLTFANGPQYARLVRVRIDWETRAEGNPDLLLFSDNYFDLLPGEKRDLEIRVSASTGTLGPIQGKLVVAGSNVPAMQIPITLETQ